MASKTKTKDKKSLQELLGDLREFTFLVSIGATGSGKSFRTKKDIKDYFKKHHLTVLIFDPNGEYEDVPIIEAYDINIPNDYERQKVFRQISIAKPFIGRIIGKKRDVKNPQNKNKVSCTNQEMKKIFLDIVEGFRGGLLVLDDMVAIEKGFRSDEAASVVNRLRHRFDVMVNFQKISLMQSAMWGAAKYIRMHKLSDDPEMVKEKLPSVIPIQVPYLLIEEYYREGFNFIKNELGTTPAGYSKNVQNEKDIKEYLKDHPEDKELLKPRLYTDKQKEEANKIFKQYTVSLNPLSILNISQEDYNKGLSLYFREYETVKISRKMKLHKCSEEKAVEILVSENQHYRG